MPSIRAIFAVFFALFLCFAAVVTTYAEVPVMCPSLKKIREMAPLINTAIIDTQKTYTAATDKLVFRDNQFLWGISISHVVANSPEEAITNAQTLIPEVTVMLSETALHYGIMYACLYFLASSSFDQAVLVLGAKEQGEMPVPNDFLR
jgi:hypothetical protein